MLIALTHVTLHLFPPNSLVFVGELRFLAGTLVFFWPQA